MPIYRYTSNVADFELSRMISGRQEVLNYGDTFEYDGQISAANIELMEEVIDTADDHDTGN